MKIAKTLNIKGVILNKEQLKNYLENIASDHTLETKSDKETYPVLGLIENFEYITKTYEMLNHHLKLGINIHQAGEWLLDNYYVIEETVKEVRKNLSLKKYVKFMGISSGKYKGVARSYLLATEIVAYTERKFQNKGFRRIFAKLSKKENPKYG